VSKYPHLVVGLASVVLAACAPRPLLAPRLPSENPARQPPAAQAPATPAGPQASELCSPAKGVAYGLRKKVAVVQFPVADPADAFDLPGFERAWAHELERRLGAEQRFLLSDASEYRLAPLAMDALGRYSQGPGDQARQIAARTGAQFVVSGRVVDVAMEEPTQMLESMSRWPTRRLGVELSVYDGATGALLAHHSYREQVQGHVKMSGLSPMGGEFLDSEFGQAVGRTLDRQVVDVVNDLACVPFTAHIVAVDDGVVRIDAGGTSLLRPNDTLRVYRHRLATAGAGHDFYQDEPAGTLVIRQVFPQFAQGAMQKAGDVRSLRPGDLVRTW